MGVWLSVPESILDNIDDRHSSHEEKTSALANYVATILPGITWEIIASTLYMCDEDRAVERVKTYLHIVPGEL